MKILIYYILLVLIVGTLIVNTPLEARLNAEIDGDECKITIIKFKGIDNYLHAVGNCSILYDMCIEDACTIKPIKESQYYFGDKVIGGDLDSTE